MFSFFSKLRSEVTSSIAAVHARILTVEAKIDTLLHHNTVVSQVEAGIGEAKDVAEEVKAEAAAEEVKAEAAAEEVKAEAAEGK